MKKTLLAATAALFIIPVTVHAQQSTAAAPNCISQYEDTTLSAASVFAQGYKIEAAVPGGLWLQKDKNLLFCNVARPHDGDVICWKLREPLKGQSCQ